MDIFRHFTYNFINKLTKRLLKEQSINLIDNCSDTTTATASLVKDIRISSESHPIFTARINKHASKQNSAHPL